MCNTQEPNAGRGQGGGGVHQASVPETRNLLFVICYERAGYGSGPFFCCQGSKTNNRITFRAARVGRGTGCKTSPRGGETTPSVIRFRSPGQFVNSTLSVPLFSSRRPGWPTPAASTASTAESLFGRRASPCFPGPKDPLVVCIYIYFNWSRSLERRRGNGAKEGRRRGGYFLRSCVNTVEVLFEAHNSSTHFPMFPARLSSKNSHCTTAPRFHPRSRFARISTQIGFRW